VVLHVNVLFNMDYTVLSINREIFGVSALAISNRRTVNKETGLVANLRPE